MTYLGVRHQAAVTAESEHRRGVRAERVEAFSAFIESVQGAHAALIAARVELGALGSASDETEALEDAESVLEHMQTASSDIAIAAKWQAKILILGPQGLVSSSIDVLQALRARASAMGHATPMIMNGVDGADHWQERESEASRSWTDAFGAFTARAAHALEGREIPTPRSE
ncbi:hypothetical protein ABZ016_12655 [Streptomyces sp. NPDC006372]|uniref:hypothetical protein n=1 Tax=Streptomyces sp. NPDC006372 TaxID=3155599 RepID=UPI0033B43F22